MKLLFRTLKILHSSVLYKSTRSSSILGNISCVRRFTNFDKNVTDALTDNLESSDSSQVEKGQGNELKSLLDDAASFNETNPPGDEWSTPVYPVLTERSQARHSVRPKVDPRTTSVVLFPGQGVQHVGMGKSLLEYENVPEMFECASEILRYNLLDLCLNGPKQMLDDTVNCQAAVMVASLAAVEKLRATSPEVIENCVATAGFSVGEYTALVFAGALDFEDAVRLLKIRGEAMQAASDLSPSGMMTVMFRPDAKIKYACAAAKEWCIRQGIEKPDCCIGIYLYPECKVLSGNIEALKFLELNAKDFGIKKIKYIPVSGAFHSDLMKPAKVVLDKALRTVSFKAPLIPVHANVDGKPYSDTKQIIKKLSEQMCNPVKWEQTMHIIFERPKDTKFPTVYECGPGSSLKTVLKKNNAKAYASCQNILA